MKTAYCLFALFSLATYGQQPQQPGNDSSSPKVQFVTVDKNVKLEVLDWGGTGRTLVLLAGLGNDAHVFYEFAPKLSASYHVYGITRRGYGASSKPSLEDGNYAVDRLADDVLAVMQALKLNKPVLVGHSIAGEELSSIGSRYPDRVAGLVYLDAGYAYAYYNAERGDGGLDLIDLQAQLNGLTTPGVDKASLVNELLDRTLPQFEKDLRNTQKQMAENPPPSFRPPPTPEQFIAQAVMRGERKFAGVKCPVLAIYAIPHDMGPTPKEHPEKFEAVKAADAERVSAQADVFAKGNPQARVVRLANANHRVFQSNEQDVLREMNAFIATLPE
jgi:non-heme chloroperoxidase